MNEPRRFHLAAALLLVLSAFDSIFTHLWLVSGVATEANPILAAAWAASPFTFHALKLVLVVSGALILLALRRTPIAQTTMAIATAVYGAVVSYHLVNV